MKKLALFTFLAALSLFIGVSYAHCYGSSVLPASGETSTTFKFCGSTDAAPTLYMDGNSKGSMSASSAGDCTDYSGTEYKSTLTGIGLTAGSHDYKVYTGHGDCTGTFEIKPSTSTTTVTDEGPYTGGSTQYYWYVSGYSLLQSILKVKQDQALKGVEQYATNITTGKKYWAVVIDVGTSKPSSTSSTGTGTVLATKELGTTSSSTTGWIGTKDGLYVELKKDHWYIIGVAVDSSATKRLYYKSSSTAVDFGWAEFQPGSYWDTQNPPDSSFGYYAAGEFLLSTRFYLKVTPPEAADTTAPAVTVTGAPSGWTNSGTAGISCTDTSGCDSNSYKIKTYASNPTTCSSKYDDYTLNVPYTTGSNVWICGAAKDTKGNVGFSSPVEFKVDKDAPSVSLSVYKSQQTYYLWVAEVQCSDGDSGCDYKTYANHKSDVEITSCPTDYSKYTTGVYTYIFGSKDYVWICGAAKDNAGNIGFTSAPEKESTDNYRPYTSMSLSGTLGNSNWHKSSVEITLKCSDTGTGCKETKYCTDTTNKCIPGTKYSSPFTVSSEGTSYVRYYSEDYNGNSELEIGAKSIVLKIDTVKPSTNALLSGTEGSNGWYTGDVTVSFICSDSTSGCNETKYCTDTTNTCNPATSYSSQIVIRISNEETTYARYNSTDKAGNSEDAKSAAIKIDKTVPSRSNGQPTGTVTVSNPTLSLATNEAATCKYSTASGTGYDGVTNTFSTTGGTPHSQSLSGLSDGTKNYYVKCKDSAGNKNTDDYTITFVIDTVPPATSISSVAGSTSAPYWDASDDKQTNIVISGEAWMSCRWDTTDIVYSSMSTNNECVISESTVTCSVGSLLQGSHTRYVSCKDVAGNEQITYSSKTTGNEDVAFGVDWTPPTTNIDSPAASSWFKSDFTVQYDATDANVDSCSISTKDATGNWAERSTTCGNDKSLTITVGGNRHCVEQGKDVCAVKVYAKDKTGLDNQVMRSFSIDYTPPTIDSLSHSPQDIITDTDVTIEVKASDKAGNAGGELAGIEIKVDGEVKRTCNSSPCLYTSKYSRGVHDYSAKVTDKAGNEQLSSTQSFKVVAPEIITAKRAWNLISIPYKTFTFVSSTCESGRNLYNYDTATKTWNIVKQVKDLQGGKGYWVFSDTGCEIRILGGEDVSQNDIQLTTGWNQIGAPANEPAFASVKSGCTLKTIIEYDATTGSWKTLKESDKLEKYKAYFINAVC